MSPTLALLAVILLVALNGFFVAAEFALVSVRASRIDTLIEQGSRRAPAVKSALKHLDHYIAGTQVGITIASLALGWIGEPAIAHLVEPLILVFHDGDGSTVLIHTVAVVVSFMVITFLHVVLGELVPKSLALQRPEGVSLTIATPMRLVVALFRPLIWSLNGLGNMLLRLMGLEPASEIHSVHSPDEIRILVNQSHKAGVLDDAERRIIQRTFQFSELTAGDVLTPRLDVEALKLDSAPAEMAHAFASFRHSRVPVYQGSTDDIAGILHLKDLVNALAGGGTIDQALVSGLLQPALVIPDVVHLDQILEQFQSKQCQIAVVVDEYGSFAGVLTLQDIVEEVFGDIGEANGTGRQRFEWDEGRRCYAARGEIRLHELREWIGWEIDDDQVETVAGFVMKMLGRPAKQGDVVETPSGKIRVEKCTRTRILEMAIIPPEV